MAPSIRWGIAGTGMIANVFARSLTAAQQGWARAVGSRSEDRAAEFARKHGIERAYGSYDALLADDEVDAVYVATPHPCHGELVVAACRAGKHVLCEKPMGVTVADCERMIAAADMAGVVLLEAFMYRVHPQTARICQLLNEGRIGTLRIVRSAFCYGLGDGGYNVRLDRSLRGGGLYDVGCYCINFSRMVAGDEPDHVDAAWTLGERTGVDETLAAVMHFPSGLVAHFDVSVRSAGYAMAEIHGSEGRLLVPSPWKPGAGSASLELRCKGSEPETIEIRDGGDVFALEADHMAAVIAGDTEPLIPARNAVGNAAVMERIWNRMFDV